MLQPLTSSTPDPERSLLPEVKLEVRRPKLVIMVNMVAPYRVPVYDRIGEAFETTVLYSNIEANRTTWQDTLSKLKHCKVKRSWGFTITRKKKGAHGVYDFRFKHITPGYFADLIRERPSAILTYELGVRTILAMLYGFLYGIPVWVWWGGTVHSSAKIRTVNAVIRKLLARCTFRWIAYGASSTEYIRSLQVPDERILQIQNCVEESLFLPQVKPAHKPSPRPALLVVGHLVGLKGVHHLLDAAAVLQRDGHTFSITFVGDGPERANMIARAKQLGLSNIEFVPGRRPEEMPAVYQSFDALVFPTLNDVWGLVANEAMLSGLPILVAKYAGCAQELADPDNIFDPLDPQDFVRALERAVTGKLSVSPISRLRTSAQVADMITRDVRAILEN